MNSRQTAEPAQRSICMCRIKLSNKMPTHKYSGCEATPHQLLLLLTNMCPLGHALLA